eukprot:gene5359-biopygen4061
MREVLPDKIPHTVGDSEAGGTEDPHRKPGGLPKPHNLVEDDDLIHGFGRLPPEREVDEVARRVVVPLIPLHQERHRQRKRAGGDAVARVRTPPRARTRLPSVNQSINQSIKGGGRDVCGEQGGAAGRRPAPHCHAGWRHMTARARACQRAGVSVRQRVAGAPAHASQRGEHKPAEHHVLRLLL